MNNSTRYHCTQYRKPELQTIDHKQSHKVPGNLSAPHAPSPTLIANMAGCTDPWQHDGCLCLPRKGELVRNGGFDNPYNPLHNWVINPGVDIIDPNLGDTAHQGVAAARLGFIRPHALLYQDISGICPGGFFQLVFFIRAAKECGNSPICVSLSFLDKNKQLLVAPAVDILVPARSLAAAYTAFVNITRWPSPQHTHFARIRFEIDTSAADKGYVNVDDISLLALAGTANI